MPGLLETEALVYTIHETTPTLNIIRSGRAVTVDRTLFALDASAQTPPIATVDGIAASSTISSLASAAEKTDAAAAAIVGKALAPYTKLGGVQTTLSAAAAATAATGTFPSAHSYLPAQSTNVSSAIKPAAEHYLLERARGFVDLTRAATKTKTAAQSSSASAAAIGLAVPLMSSWSVFAPTSAVSCPLARALSYQFSVHSEI